MNTASKRNWLYLLMQGSVLVSFAAAIHAEPVSTKQAAAVSQTKAVQYIENKAPVRQKKQQLQKSKEIKIEDGKAPPAKEADPLELKGVRG